MHLLSTRGLSGGTKDKRGEENPQNEKLKGINVEAHVSKERNVERKIKDERKTLLGIKYAA